MRNRVASIAFDRGGLLALATLVLYVALASRHVVDGEDSHFATLGVLGGVAHPSGYPLYVLWLRAMWWVPAASPAHAAAIATAMLAAAAVLALHAACRAWGARPLAATLACAIFAAAPPVLVLATEAEVFALNDLVVALVLWLAAVSGPVRGARRCALLGLVAGLGLANHMTCALVAPVGILGVVRGVREAPRAAGAAALGALGLAVGLAPYVYLVIAPANDASWGGDVIDLVLRRAYGGPTGFADTGAEVAVGSSLGALATTVARAWLWLPGAAGLVWLVARVARPSEPGHEPRWGWAMLLASIVLAGPVLASRFDVPPESVGLYVVRRFHVLPVLLLAVPVAGAFDRARGLVARVPAMVGAGLGIVVLVAATGPSLDHVARVHAPAVEDAALNTLRSLPPDAIVFGADDDLAAAIPYAQLVLGVRRDVIYVQWPMVSFPWYQARLAARGNNAGTIADLLDRGRAVFVESSMHRLARGYPTTPHGILERVMPRDAKAPTLAEVLARQKAVYAAFTLDYPRPGAADEWPAAVHRRYAAPWSALGRALEAAGLHDDAAWAFAAAREIGPHE